MVKYEWQEENYESIENRNIDDKSLVDAREVFAMPQNDEEATTDVKTDVMLQDIFDDTLADDDQIQGHKTNLTAHCMKFKEKCFKYSKSEPPNPAAIYTFRPA